jgi:succinoglycan biosynthesis transport protein ExoP
LKTLIEPHVRSVTQNNRELTINDLLKIFVRRRVIIVGAVLVMFSLAVLACIFTPRRYEATGQLQVQKESMDGLGLSSMMGDAAGASDALDGNITIQTQATILQSDTLALRVIKDLNLEQTEDFKPKFNPLGWVLGLIAPAGPRDPAHASLEDAPGRRTHASLVFSRNLQVKPISGTRLIEITYYNPDPKIAAAVVNHLIQALTDYSFQTRYNATSQASDWLGGQLSDLRKQSEDLQAKVVKLQRDSGVYTLGGGTESSDSKSQGGTGIYSSVLDRLQQATASLTLAESNRILKGAVYQAVKSGDAEMISGLAGDASLTSASSGLSNSLSLIQNFRLQEATLQGQLDQLSAKFGPTYPKLEEIRGNLGAIDQALKSEVGRVAIRAKNDYAVAQTIEGSARAIFEQEKTQADNLNDKAIEYTIVRQEAEQSRTLYESLLSHLKEAGVLEGLKSSNITVVDPARVPAKPAKPNVPLYLAGSIALGLFLGCGGAFLVDLQDNKIHDLTALELQTGHMPLGILPYYVSKARLTSGAGGGAATALASGPGNMIALEEPHSPYVEALRALRTSLLLSRGGAPPKVVLVTSSIASEGKTTLCLNLAILLAQHGKKVLLVDADLRRPMLHKRLSVTTQLGLSSLLAGQYDPDELPGVVPLENVPGLRVLFAGPVPPYPSELLGSAQMRTSLKTWRDQFDFILLDGAPVLPVTDSVILSELVDATLLVARFNLTERQSLERSYHLLEMQAGPEQTIGFVLNAVERGGNSYYDYFGYSDSAYYGAPAGSVA